LKWLCGVDFFIGTTVPSMASDMTVALPTVDGSVAYPESGLDQGAFQVIDWLSVEPSA
jgi:hypothetical protein